jgi:hypothetical protein
MLGMEEALGPRKDWTVSGMETGSALEWTWAAVGRCWGSVAARNCRWRDREGRRAARWEIDERERVKPAGE